MRNLPLIIPGNLNYANNQLSEEAIDQYWGTMIMLAGNQQFAEAVLAMAPQLPIS